MTSSSVHYVPRTADFDFQCAYCGALTTAEVPSLAAGGGGVRWATTQSGARVVVQDGTPILLVCGSPKCREGSVIRPFFDEVAPGAAGVGMVNNLPPDVRQAWEEAIGAIRGGAPTAAASMCRKILSHVAFDQTGNERKTFLAYVDDLKSEGYIAKPQHSMADEVRQQGNAAAHDLAAVSQKAARRTMKLTHHLLEAVYGMRDADPDGVDE